MRRIQFSIATLLILTAVVALYLVPDDKSWTDSMSMAVNDANHRLLVQSGVRDRKLLFVAIAGEPINSAGSTNGIVRGGGGVGYNWHKIHYPDGSEHLLPRPGSQLFQWIDGQWTESNGDITPEEFTMYCASKPREFTIQSLMAFVEQQRQDSR